MIPWANEYDPETCGRQAALALIIILHALAHLYLKFKEEHCEVLGHWDSRIYPAS